MPSELPEETQPAEGALDQGLPPGGGQGAGGGEWAAAAAAGRRAGTERERAVPRSASPFSPLPTQDRSFEFEKRRHEPVKYQRELWSQSGTAEGGAPFFPGAAPPPAVDARLFFPSSGSDEASGGDQAEAPGQVRLEQVGAFPARRGNRGPALGCLRG